MILTVTDLARRDYLENLIRSNLRAYTETCAALLEIYEKKYWKETHTTFGQYAMDRLGIRQQSANYWLSFSRISAELMQACPDLPMPDTLGKTQILQPLPSEHRKVVWEEACAQSGGMVPTVGKIREVRASLNELMANSEALTGNYRREMIARVRAEEGLASQAIQKMDEEDEHAKSVNTLKRALEGLEKIARMLRRTGCNEEASAVDAVVAGVRQILSDKQVAA